MKRAIAMLLAVLLLGSLAGCAGKVQTVPAHVEGALFGGANEDNIPVEVRFDPAWITTADNTVYQKDLAAFAALLSTDTYFRAKDLEKGKQNRVLQDGHTDYDWTDLLKSLGFTDVEYVESFRQKEYTADTNDSATLLMGHQVTDGKYDTYVFTLRGAFSIQERFSAFDPGWDGEAYTALTGEHPEWTDPQASKGLAIGAGRAKEFMQDFMAAHDDPALPNCVLCTGHSRGGSLANLLGAGFETDPDVRSYTYTFDAMGVTTEPQPGDFHTIFNLFDTNDYYSDPLPFGQEPFYRYGQDLSLDLSEKQEILDAVAKLVGRDDYAGFSAKVRERYNTLFGEKFPDRASLYDPLTLVWVFDTQQEAEARLAECQKLMGAEEGLALEPLCRMGEVAEDAGKYTVTMEYCGAALLIGYAQILAYGEPAATAFTSLFDRDDVACEIAALLLDNLAAMNSAHRLADAYVMAGYVK